MKSHRTLAITTLTAGALGALALALLVHPTPAHAAIVDMLPADPTKIGKDDIVRVIMNLIQWALAFASAIAAIFIAVNGYQYVLSAGNPEKLEKAKMGLTWSVGGFILAISSYGIVYLVASTLQFTQLKRLEDHRPASVPGTVKPVVESIADIIFWFGGAVAVFFLIVGGYRYMTSQGDREAVEKAKKTVLYALIGLIILFAAVLIFNLVSTTVIGGA